MLLEISWLLELLFFSVLHWILAGIILNDIIVRRRVMGGNKAFWMIFVMVLVFAGSVVYLICHPQAFTGENR